MNNLRILVVDDHELVRAGLIANLARYRPQWAVVGQASNGMEAFELATTLKPDVTVLDLLMPQFGGIHFIRKLQIEANTRVLVITGFASDDAIQQVEQSGACGLLSKIEAFSQLVPAIEQTLDNGPFFALTGAGLKAESRPVTPVQLLLSLQELEIFRLMATGRRLKDIAGIMGVGVRRAQMESSAVRAKLAAPSIADLTRLAIRDHVI
jgi:DNA-binding NarL/FixJ family response regulator